MSLHFFSWIPEIQKQILQTLSCFPCSIKAQIILDVMSSKAIVDFLQIQSGLERAQRHNHTCRKAYLFLFGLVLSPVRPLALHGPLHTSANDPKPKLTNLNRKSERGASETAQGFRHFACSRPWFNPPHTAQEWFLRAGPGRSLGTDRYGPHLSLQRKYIDGNFYHELSYYIWASLNVMSSYYSINTCTPLVCRQPYIAPQGLHMPETTRGHSGAESGIASWASLGVTQHPHIHQNQSIQKY